MHAKKKNIEKTIERKPNRFCSPPPELRAAVKEIKRKTVELNYILPQKGTMSSAKNTK